MATTKISKKPVVKKPVVKKPVVKKPVVKKIDQPKIEKPTLVYKESTYTDKNIQISPRKLRLLANTIKKLKPSTVTSRLQFTNTKSARVLIKAVKTALATAKNNYQIDPDTTSFVSIQVDEGQKIKRMDKSHGSRFARGIITRRHSRLKIVIKGQVK